MTNEKRLIDANEALEKLEKLYATQHFGEWYIPYDDAYKLLKNAPTVDAVELPKGRPGDYLEWDNGTGFRQITTIDSVIEFEEE